MRYIGIDFGEKRVGLAMGDAEVGIAGVLQAVRRVSDADCIEAIRSLVEKEGVGGLVIGLPLNMDDSVGLQAKRIERFARKLQEATGLVVSFVDERLTTDAAKRLLRDTPLSRQKRTAREDGLAARIILQTFFDSKKWSAVR